MRIGVDFKYEIHIKQTHVHRRTSLLAEREIANTKGV